MAASLPSRAAISLIRLYQVTLSPLIGRGCRHMPSCSHFAADAIGQHGLWIGGWMALARVVRCRPGGSHGWDPAPLEAPRARWFAPWNYGDWRSGYRAPKDSHGHHHACS